MHRARLRKLKQALASDPSLIDAEACAMFLMKMYGGLSEKEARSRFNRAAGSDIEELLDRVAPDGIEGAIDYGALYNYFPFPVHEDYFIDCACELRETGGLEWLQIPIHSLNDFEAWDGFEEWPTAYQLAWLLNRPPDVNLYDRDEEANWKHFSEKVGLPPKMRPKGRVDSFICAQFFEASRSPLKHLPMAIQMMEYSTGVIFFDFSCQQDAGDVEVYFNEENVEELTQHYQRGLGIDRDLKTLRDWIDADPRANSERAIRLYNKARRLTDEQKNDKRRRGGAQPGTLASVLAAA